MGCKKYFFTSEDTKQNKFDAAFMIRPRKINIGEYGLQLWE